VKSVFPDWSNFSVAPEVECISKGKAHKKYEFGVKVSVASTAVGNWCIGSLVCPGNPYDGHTFGAALDQVVLLTGVTPRHAYCDLGYRGSGYEGPVQVHVVDRRKKASSPWERRWRRRRAAVEPVIGHLKSDHRMNRNYYQDTFGDRVNALLGGAGYNLSKLLALLARRGLLFLSYFCHLLRFPHTPQRLLYDVQAA